MAVFMELAPGDTLRIGKSIVRLEYKTGARARLSVDSAEHIERIKAHGPRAPQTDAPAKPAVPSTEPMPFLKRPLPAAT